MPIIILQYVIQYPNFTYAFVFFYFKTMTIQDPRVTELN